MFYLLCVEALTFVFFHGSRTMNCLNEANHRFITLWIKIDIVTCANSWEPGRSIFQRIVTDRALDIVPEIAGESLAVRELNAEGLIVYGRPCSGNLLAVAFTWCWAQLSCCFVSVQELHATCFLLWKLELMILSYDLNFIGEHVGADFIGLE